jgi:hypothetical protein
MLRIHYAIQSFVWLYLHRGSYRSTTDQGALYSAMADTWPIMVYLSGLLFPDVRIKVGGFLPSVINTRY